MGKTIEPGPVVGAPPTLEWIPIGQLQIDPAYQRATDTPKSRVIIVGMVKRWDWSLCQPLVVSRRDSGELFVLDGQHRLSGARERGDVPHLPCVVVRGVDEAGEALTFVALNTKLQKLSQGELFNGMLAAGDPEAKRLAEILGETGWRHARTSNTATYKPGELFCGPRLVRSMKAHGEAPIRNALVALREAYPDTPVRIASTMLTALIAIYRDNDLDGYDPDLFIETLGSCEPADWLEFGRDERRRSPALSSKEALARAMVMACEDSALDEAA